MTGEEHIVTWIESSAPHYRELLKLVKMREEAPISAAQNAVNLVASAYREMLRTGDALRDDRYSLAELMKAAKMLCEWEAPK